MNMIVLLVLRRNSSTSQLHKVTGDLNIVENTCLRDLISKGPKYREPQKFSWKYNFKLIMDSVKDYARSWTKQEDVELDTLSE